MKAPLLLACVSALALAPRVATADAPEPRSPNTALLLSAGGTLASVGLFALGAHDYHKQNEGLELAGTLSALVTPSLGQWYAGQYVTIGMAARAAGGVAFVAGLSEESTCIGYEGRCTLGRDNAEFLWLAGAFVFAGGVIYDVAAARSAAADYNTRHRAPVALAPTILSSPSGPVMGVGLGGSF